MVTPSILDSLAAHDAHATFSMEGRHVHAAPEVALRVVQEGHVVGNHTWDHWKLGETCRSLGEVQEQLATTSDEIERVTGTRPELFRAPGSTWAMASARPKSSARHELLG